MKDVGVGHRGTAGELRHRGVTNDTTARVRGELRELGKGRDREQRWVSRDARSWEHYTMEK